MKKLLLSVFFLSYSILGIFAYDQDSKLHEFRGVWVATVTNIDWPSQKGLSTAQLKKEVRDILDLQKELGMNSVILQVRPASDAIYPSKLEPWSRYISGVQGKAPGFNFDPLQYWIEEAHKRDIELHAWINPFRASLNLTDSLHHSHPARLNPHWTITYGNKLHYDPSQKEVRQHILNVIDDLISRYDLDGLHMDDYFYPYPIHGEVFNDSSSYIQQLNFEAPLSIHDWRRQNIDTLISSVAQLIQQKKPWISFGISPFGVWRNQSDDERGSDTRAGVTCYDHLYADVLKWVDEEWIDYVAPQIYWSTKDEVVNYTKLLHWWNQNINSRHLYIGHGIYKINGVQPNWDHPNEMTEQIQLSRKLDNVKGNIFYSHKHFIKENNELNKTLSQNLFKKPALSPPMPWKKSNQLETATSLKYKRRVVTWEYKQPNPGNEKTRYVVFITPLDGDEAWWEITSNSFFTPTQKGFSSKKKNNYLIEIAAIDKSNNLGPISESIKVSF